MTDLEAKISSEFAAGDPTVATNIEPLVKPTQQRVSLRRIAPAIAVLLLVGGATITYFAATPGNATHSEATAVTSTDATDVASATTSDTPANVVTNTSRTGKNTIRKPVNTAAITPTAPVVTPAPQPMTTPNTPKKNDLATAVQNLTTGILDGVSDLLQATISVVL